jgi:hypothetical protein
MSLTREDTVICPGCGAPGSVVLHSSIDATKEPALKESLLRGALSVFTCGKCGRKARIAHSLLYTDAAQGLVLQLDPEDTFDAAAALALLGKLPGGEPRVSRVVRDGNALIEKVRLRDHDLDDRVVEVMKLLLALAHKEFMGFPWYFERTEADGALVFVIMTAKGPHGTRRPRAEYDALAADMEKAGALGSAGPFARIGRDFAQEWLSRPVPGPAPAT